MSSAVEVEKTVAEQPQAEAMVTEKPAEKPAKEKKTKAPKEKKPKAPKTAAHPPYFEMIKEALTALNEKSGSSPHAIAKFMEEKHKAVLPANFRKILGLQLKNSEARGKLIKIKASYKLSDGGKKPKPAKANAEKKKPVPKSTAKTTRLATAKKPEAVTKKPAKKAKKSAAAATKPKQPKSIKSPAAKRAKKATAA